MNKTPKKKKALQGFWFASVTAIMLLMSACGSATPAAPEQAATKPGSEQAAQPAAGENKPVTIVNNGIEMTYPEAPKRAVTMNQHVTEIMLALGLADKMAGTAYLDDQILPELKADYDRVPVLSDKYPTKEVLMAANPDFVYAGWKSAFGDKGVGSMEELEKAGVKSYLQESSNKPGPTIDDVFADIANIGRIFRVEDKANELIGKMKAEMEQTTSKIGTVDKPLSVFVYDSGEDQPFTAANNYMTALIKAAGGKNVFDDIQKGWATVSWEEVVNRKPDVIVVVDYGDKTIDQKKEFLLAKKELADLPAIQNKRLIVLPLSAASEGVRAPIALKILGEGLYPDKFK
ncbi:MULTISPECIES: ABC transporter substrate-binding protein [Brevibacillus]|jgi:ABC-type Fe3+-hydroxamate transport system, periplasmic component|uniref:ABC transporter substrate-binding protein n=1 Tax=Brevibacillus TaxID=55080 RepID=UPI000EBC7500|nr:MULTISPECIES: ABC transporter substrate-binding protein [Brevibacillus]MDH6352943.1 iron complex transport system substrate-binding protein [Brevibacillus sp. 1238]MDR5000796.1 ABC transporter substrate-binding protein [Brevibacillus parabrevis]MED2253097.1 ABC transporter substrate-binding protein [Brevibacillus parabrevis]UED71033.1 ABC transporter substrate-binding protein [Brevibacillus sp. HD3.3A]HBZ78830.1 Fe3+-hydroxamate ABC transporter substrate-binding protein [Brevibacillus sp.]